MKQQQKHPRKSVLKRPLFLALAACCIGCCHYTEANAQATDTQTAVVDTLISDSINNKVYDMVDQMPEYPGGIQAIMRYLSQTVNYPQELQALGVQGRVIVQFVVRKDGQVVNAKVYHSLHPDLDKEALMAISSMPLWTPGKIDGKAVNVKFTIPINFRPTPPPVTVQETVTQQTDSIEDKVYMTAQKMPQFPGGLKELNRYIERHITYWRNAIKQKEEGRVVVTFVVRKDGRITDAKVIHNVSPTLDAEAVRIISNMPVWEPGIENGENISVRFTIPVVFKLR